MTSSQAITPNYRDSVDSDSHSLSDSEDHSIPRDSYERRRYDQQILDEEVERSKLLTGKAIPSDPQDAKSSSVRRMLKKRSRKKRKHGEEKKELMYEVEEGAEPSRRSSSESSSERDREKLGAVHARRTRPNICLKICKIGMINVVIAGIFIAIAYGAYRATWDNREAAPALVSNGSALFAPTTILLSLDGFRADYVRRGITPNLIKFIKQGTSPDYLLPSFPSVTFPNHYTMVTGLYPESHGIVGNSFWDPELKEEFYHTNKSAMKAKWWVGEPLWVTAELQGIRTATHMWPGSEAHISHLEPSFVDKYNGSEDLNVKVDRLMELLDKPGPNEKDLKHPVDDQRPQLILAYVPNVDSAGHKYGPNSTEIRDSIVAVDNMLGRVLDALNERNLSDIVNLIVVSDHGMATTSIDRTIQLEDLVNTKYFDHIDGWPHCGLWPKDSDLLEMVYDHLVKESQELRGFDVYLRDENMPERYHFSNNERIAPLWVMPHTGWAITTLDEMNVSEALENGDEYHPRGMHGYDHDDPLMRAIFVARGPAFPSKAGSRVESFRNTELYNILCDSVGVEPLPNNGTIRLPLSAVSVHTDDEFTGDETTFDPPTTTRKPNVATDATQPPTPDATSPLRPTIDKVNGTDVNLADEKTWPDWFRDKFAKLKGWIKSVFGSATQDGDKEDSNKWVPPSHSDGTNRLHV